MLVNIKPVVCLAVYEINLDYIATVLCINKDRVDMTESCNGNCQLSKEIEDKEKQDRLSNIYDNLLPHEINFQSFHLIHHTERYFSSDNKTTPTYFHIIFTPPPQV